MEMGEVLALAKSLWKVLSKPLLWLVSKLLPRSLVLSRTSAGNRPRLSEGSVVERGTTRKVSVFTAAILATNVARGRTVVSSARAILLFPRWYRPIARSGYAAPLLSDVGRPGVAGLSDALDQGDTVLVHVFDARFDFAPPRRRRVLAKVSLRDQADRAHRTKWFPADVYRREQAQERANARREELRGLRQTTDAVAERLLRDGHSPEIVSLLISTLRAETEAYRRNGRRSGGLGSIAFTYGGRTFDGVPSVTYQPDTSRQQLLVEDPQNASIDSVNARALVRACEHHYGRGSARLAMLLSSLAVRDSEFAEVGYMIVYSAYRLGVLAPVLQAATEQLRGHRPYSFSEVLRLTSGILRFAYTSLTEEELQSIETSAVECDEDDFALPILVAQARVLRADRHPIV